MIGDKLRCSLFTQELSFILWVTLKISLIKTTQFDVYRLRVAYYNIFSMSSTSFSLNTSICVYVSVYTKRIQTGWRHGYVECFFNPAEIIDSDTKRFIFFYFFKFFFYELYRIGIIPKYNVALFSIITL